MRRGRSSTTAAFVATMRGLAGFSKAPVVSDPYAARLLDGPFRLGLAVAERVPAAAKLALRTADVITRGKVRHLELRTRAIDEVVEAEAKRGVGQLVLLGAGLDARAHRLSSLGAGSVFEIDHPDTQRKKRAAVGDAGGRVRYVAVDFERDDLVARLTAAGFEPSAPATFVWEGVTMYLSEAAVKATIASVARLAAPGSAFLVSYHEPKFRLEGVLATIAVRALGEPFRLRVTPAEFASWLSAAGFSVESDESDDEWGMRYLGTAVPSVGERIVCGRRR